MKTNTIIILFAISKVLTKHHHHHRRHHHYHLADILNFKENFFSKTNLYVQNIMNKIFEELDLPKQFIHDPKVKLLLTMHYDLNNIAEKNFEIYDVLRNITVVTVENKAVNKIRLDETVREILNEKNENKFNVHVEIKDKNKNRSTQIPLTTKKPMPGFNDSREFKEFIKGFLSKVRRLTVNDLFKKKGSPKGSSALFDSTRRNLDVWEPPANIESDWTVNSNESRRIYRGKKTNIETFPFVASIHLLDEFMCAGSIISKDLILTAASCVQIHYNNRFFRENPKTTYVRIGSEWTSRRGEIIPVLEIFFYPTYDPKTLKHNLAILRLERIMKFQSRRRTKIRRIQLDHGDGNLPANTREVVILGWGAKKPNQIVNTFEKLTVAFLNIYPVEECRKIYTKDYVSETNFCAGFMSRGGGACNRDVGAPGVVGGLLVGVVSFGAPICGTPDSPTVYTRVGNYINWIESIIENPPPRFGKPKTTKMTSRAYVYYFNTVSTRTYPRLMPIGPTTRVYPLALRAQDEKNFPEEDVLREILTDIVDQNDTMIYDIINQDLNDDFFEIFNSSVDNPDLAVFDHPLINKTLYLIPGIHFEPPPPTNETTPSIEPTYEFDVTKADNLVTEPFLRMNHTTAAPVYDDYDDNSYESATKEQQENQPQADYDKGGTDSEASRQEYFDKLKTAATEANYKGDDLTAHTLNKKQITQPIYVEPNPVTEDDYSRDVAFEI